MYYLAGTYYDQINRTIESGCSVATNGKMLYPDEYTVMIKGENLSKCRVNLSYNPYIIYKKRKMVWNRPHYIQTSCLEIEDGFIVINFTLTDIVNNFRVEIVNDGDCESQFKDMLIIKDDVYYADFYSSIWMDGGVDDDGKRYLEPGGKTFGPYITLIPGTYMVECKGKGLDKISYECTYKNDDQTEQFSTRLIDQTDNHLAYEFEVDSTSDNCEIWLSNTSDAEIEIQGLHMQRR